MTTRLDHFCNRVYQAFPNYRKMDPAFKSALWSAGSMAAAFIPVPFLNGFLTGAMIFTGTHEVLKMTDFQDHVSKRSWKHLTAGAVSAASGYGAGLGCANLYIGLFYITVGCIASMTVAYTDRIIQGEKLCV